MPVANIANQVGHIAYGMVDSTGAAISITTGFKPKVVMLRNVGGNCTMDWFDGMGDGYGQKVSAGTISTVISGGVTPADNGFVIGTDADINPGGGEDIYFVAMG